MFLHFSSQVALAVGLAPAADAFAGTVQTDVFNMGNFSKAVALINKGAGAVGTTLWTVMACDNVAGDNPVAIPFGVVTQDADGQNRSSVTNVDATGFTTAATASHKIYQIELQADQLPAAKPCFFLKGVEQADGAVNGVINVLFFGGRYQGSNLQVPTL